MRTFGAILFVVFVALASVVKATDYTANGPCASEVFTSKVPVPRAKLLATVTLPKKQQPAAGCPAAPYPIVVFFSGFSVSNVKSCTLFSCMC